MKKSFLKRFFPPSIPELIILSVLIMLIVISSSIFVADGIIFTQVLMSTQRTAPDKNDAVARIENYKASSGRYPPELFRVGLRNQYGTVFLAYVADESFFQLCYRYFPYLGLMSDCYDSESRTWSAQ